MNHPIPRSNFYVPKTDPEEWESRAKRIAELYGKLELIMKQVQSEHPDAIRLNSKHSFDGDGFSRVNHVAGNASHVISVLARRPMSEGFDRLCDYYAPITRDAFECANVIFHQYLSGPEHYEARTEALRISDDLEWALNESYAAAETMRGDKKRER